jgi:hypothetical protein
MMRRFASVTNLVLTDSPIYAVRAGLRTVPDLAVVSAKRAQTGYLTGPELVAHLTRYAPEQVLLTNEIPAAMTEPLVAAMRDRYALVYTPPDLPAVRLYVRTDVLEHANGAGVAAAAGS